MRKNGFSTPKIIDTSPKSPIICEENDENERGRGENVLKTDLMELLVREGSSKKAKDALACIAEQGLCVSVNGEEMPVSTIDSASSNSSGNSTNFILENYRPRSKTSITSIFNFIVPPNKYQSDVDQDNDNANDASPPGVTPALTAEDDVSAKNRNKQGDANYPFKSQS